MTRFFTIALVLGLSFAAAHAGDLVNDTKDVIVVQKGVRHPQTGVFTWTHTINLMPGNYVNIPTGQWFRHDSHVRDGQTTYSLPGNVPANRRHYFFLYGNEVRIDVTRP